jgi:hypothetical protein
MAFQLIPFLLQILVSVAISFVAAIIMPRPKTEKPDEVKDLELPTAEAGRPIPVVFGEITVKSPNVLWYGEKRTEKKNVQ